MRGGATKDPETAGLKTAMARLTAALAAVKAYVARAGQEITATAEELEGMIGGNE